MSVPFLNKIKNDGDELQGFSGVQGLPVPAFAGLRSNDDCGYASQRKLLSRSFKKAPKLHRQDAGKNLVVATRRQQKFPREFLVFRLFFGTKHKGPLNKVQVWGYSDAGANATAPYCPAVLEELPGRPCA